MTGDGYDEWTATQRRELRVKAIAGQPAFALLGLGLFWGSSIPQALLIAWACSFALPTMLIARSAYLTTVDLDRSDKWALAYRVMMGVVLGALAWLEPGLAGTTPHGYLLGFTVVIPTATETISAAVFADRRRHYGLVTGLMIVPATAAYLFNQQWLMAFLMVVWGAMMHSTLRAGSMMRDELERLRDAHHHDARHDALTGLLNRKGFIERLAQVSNSDDGVLIAVVDVDRFKLLNDSLGHRVGDLVLVELARRLVAEMPMGSVVGRIGGDEFVALVPSEGMPRRADEVLAVADRVSGVCNIEGNDVQVSVSIGVSPLRPGNDPLADLAEADLSMYRSKRRRHATDRQPHAAPDSQVRPLRADAVRRVEIERALRQGLQSDRLRFVAQPIVGAATLIPSGVELLARLTDEHGNAISPAEFVPVAEETGLDLDLGRRALEAAASLRNRWARSEAFGDVSVSINVSAAHLTRGLADDVRAHFPGGAQGLVIELVETQLLAADEAVRAAMHRIKAEGAHLHIDDFGTGYSSLGYLLSLPIDGVKLDRSFITGLEGDARQRDLVAAIVTLTRALRVPCVAEGVEGLDVIPHLRSAGMSLLQGYAFSRPVELDALEELLSDLGVEPPAEVRAQVAPFVD